MIFQCFVVALVMQTPVIHGAPSNQREMAAPPKEFFKFMENFGYLAKNVDNSEALYSQDAIVHAIKKVQKFGAIPETGYLDTKTLQLMSSPRCGVADVTPVERRSRRFVIGSVGWKKRTITYFIANWSPKVGEAKVVADMATAFKAWSKYSRLRFRRVFDPSADIIIAFGSGDHYDNYPFDGPGNILAHAFYPYEMNSFGGDIHFDDDENWRENTTHLHEGVDFLSVAVHELGHSLGLAHSFDYGSIMFPYYKGTLANPQLGYDDILAMYKLYIQTVLEGDDEASTTENEVESTTESVEITEAPASTTQTPLVTYDGDFETVDSFKRRTTPILPTTVTAQPTVTPKNNQTEAIPNICRGNFDAVSVLRGEVFIFKESYVWRLTDKYRIKPGYPVKIRQIFPQLPESIQKIDAIYERETDNAIVMFSGDQYWVYDGLNFIEDSPRPLADYGIEGIEKLDAAMVWAKNGKTYLFAGEQFWRYNETVRQMDAHYPMKMDRWNGVPRRLDAATTMTNGKTYFFKGNYYWLFNNKWVRPARGYPRRASTVWLGCSLN